ncbi:TrkH family potassium uptake protein [Nocardiopsis sp. HNM0947]|uniref:TrkH family potassium uptake protein n=1 Tax=Nocardiopsis coralli TaxID=2772213 RepID=A0ABR9PA20_9ACTN|nr:potassium transporter TrkG [Nocardiopsis coralli]MBE3000689.1 TrkH family potassium uptake protein [Nocardiopsis coralli]
MLESTRTRGFGLWQPIRWSSPGRSLRLWPRRRRPEGRSTQEAGPWLKPARVFLLLFLLVDLVGTGLLMSSWATTSGGGLDFTSALFTATTSLAVCGLSIVSIGDDLSTWGQGVVLALMQIGGMGIMTLAALLGTAVIHRFGLRMQLNVQAETRSLWIGDVRGVVSRVLIIFAVVQGAVFVLVTPRLWLGYDMGLGEASYVGLFHSISAFNNAGLSLYDDSLTRFSGDALVLFPVVCAVILGGIGFPVLIELRRHIRAPRRWSLHTKITVTTALVLFTAGAVLVTLMEWDNPDTLGQLSGWAKITDGLFHGVMPRSGGLNVVETGQMQDSTLLLTIMLMFVGNGSAGTAGGIKVATLAVIFLVILAEVRGQDQVHVYGRQLPSEVIRQALSLVFLSATIVAVSTVLLVHTTAFSLTQVLFETTSAFAVVGLSTGITGDLPQWAQILLAVLMVAGRVGPITFVTALAFRERHRRYQLAEARPIIG